MVKLQWMCTCGQRHDVQRHFEGRTSAAGRPVPEHGDVMLCVGCGEPFAFQNESEPVKLAWSTLVQLLRDYPERLRSFTMARVLIRGMN